MAHLKEEDDHHKRWGHERCVKAPSHDLAHISATEGTERGRRGGIAPAWVALNEVRRPVCRIPFLLGMQHVLYGGRGGNFDAN